MELFNFVISALDTIQNSAVKQLLFHMREFRVGNFYSLASLINFLVQSYVQDICMSTFLKRPVFHLITITLFLNSLNPVIPVHSCT